VRPRHEDLFHIVLAIFFLLGPFLFFGLELGALDVGHFLGSGGLLRGENVEVRDWFALNVSLFDRATCFECLASHACGNDKSELIDGCVLGYV